MQDGFNEALAAQVAAFFIERSGGEIPVLKLVKLVYLSDRESMSKTGYPITNDQFVSMPHGPVNSLTLNFIDGHCQSSNWSALISDRANHMVGLSKTITRDDLDELSDFDITILEDVWKKFGKMDRWEIRDWTHEHCPEWEDPKGSCIPIPHERVLKYLGLQHATDLASETESERHIDITFSQLKV